MYLLEYISFLSASGRFNKGLTPKMLDRDKQLEEQVAETLKKYNGDFEECRLNEEDFATPLTRPVAGVEPSDMGCVYRQTDHLLEVRTAFDEWRGFSILFLVIGCLAIIPTWSSLFQTLYEWYLGVKLNGRPINTDHIVGGIIGLIYSPFVAWVFFKYVAPWLRLEIFTQRRIIVRFNRNTRKVWLHRPKMCGGIVALDWDASGTGVGKNPQNDRMEGLPYLGIAWFSGYGGANIFTSQFIGRRFNNDYEVAAFWEYIRRFMQDGPESLPPLKKPLSRWPLPWVSLAAPWSFFMPILNREPLLILLFIWLSPVLLIWGVWHWLSLLLCWEPRFPKEAD